MARSLEFITRVAPVQEAELFFRTDRHLSRLLIQRDRPIPEVKVLVLTACQFSPDVGPPVFGQDGPLAEMARGWGNACIVGESCLAERMVTNYVSRIHAGLGVSSRAEATVWAREHGLGGGEQQALADRAGLFVSGQYTSAQPARKYWCTTQKSTGVPIQSEQNVVG